LGLDIVTQRVSRLMLFQTLTTGCDDVFEQTYNRNFSDRALLESRGWPKMAFLEHGFSADPTNWWVPNHAACEAMLRSAGMRILSRPAHEFYLCQPDPSRPSCVATWNKAELLSASGQSANYLAPTNGGHMAGKAKSRSSSSSSRSRGGGSRSKSSSRGNSSSR